MDAEAVAPIPSAADFEAAGLYDPSDENAELRLRLLELIAAHGATIAEMVEASDRLPTIVIRLADEHRQIYTASDMAERIGTSREEVVEIWRAAGFADPGDSRRFSESDLEALRLFVAGKAFVGHAHAVQFVRVLGNAVARVADAAVSVFVVDVARAALARDPVGLDLTRQNLQIAALLPTMETTVGTLLRHHLELAQRSPDQVRGEAVGYDTMPLAVGFVDIVDSTVMSRSLAPRDLAEALGVFESVMSDLVVGAGGRLVKLIGDEAMFVCRNPADACAVALEAARTFSAHPTVPQVRAGLAHGDLILREGDCFGPVVNLAARLVKQARPNSVVVDARLAALVAGFPGLVVGSELLREVKGFDTPVRYAELSRSDAKPTRA